MGKKAPARSIEEQVRGFEDAGGLVPPPPPNLGNFPDDLDRPHPSVERAAEREAAAEHPEPPEPDEQSTAAEPEPPEQPEPPDRMAELETRLAGVEREREFLRLALERGGTPQTPQAADPISVIDSFLGGYQITPADVQAIISDPETGAKYLMNGLRAAIAAGAALALQQGRSEFTQYVGQQQGAVQLRDLFYGQHPDLEPYARLVKAHAEEIRQQYPNVDAVSLVNETAKRVRGELKDYGITPAASGAPAGRAPAAPRGTVTRFRPARGEMGGSRGGGGGGTQTKLEQQLRQFEHAVGYGR